MAAAQWHVAGLLAVAWTLTLLYGEWLQYLLHAPLCRDLLPERTEVHRMDRGAFEGNFTVAILSSPKLMVSSGRALMAHQIRSDLKLRRRFRSNILHRASPDLVVVLGDLFSRPLSLTGNEWDESLRRYRHIFDPLLQTHGTRRSLRRKARKIPRVLQIPGPTDVMQTPGALEAMEEYFSQLSNAFSLDLSFAEPQAQAFTLIGLNSAAADGNISNHHTRTFWNFVEHSKERRAASRNSQQTVAVSPLPMGNSQGTICLSLGRSHWMPTQIPKELSFNTTSRIVAALEPSLFISGHGGETCWQAQHSPGSSARSADPKALAGTPKNRTARNPLLGGQILLGSFNPTRAQSAPFLLLSSPLMPPKETSRTSKNKTEDATPKMHLQLCVSTSQMGLTMWYYLLAIISASAFLLTPPRGPSPLEEIDHAFQHVRSQMKAAKLKTENGEASYTEVLDAEGNMILVPKLEAAPEASAIHGPLGWASASQRDGGPQHRGRQSRDPELGQSAPLSPRSASAKGAQKQQAAGALVPSLGVLRSRLLSAAGPLAALVGCELAFYMGLLASDWA